MTIEHLQVKFAASEIDAQTGEFKGYGAVFGNIDSHGDVIMPGAFKDTLAEWAAKGRFPAMKLMHGSGGNPFTGDDLPIGKWTKMMEDANGLYVEGKLSGLDTDRGRMIHGLVKDGILDGLSIGYRPTKARAGEKGARRMLDAVKLREVSLVDEPSNDKARMTSFKSEFNPRILEDGLRDAGLSRADSLTAVSVFKSLLLRDEAEPNDDLRDEEEAAIKSEAQLLQLAESIKALIAG
ncbi:MULTISPECIES: HK97 family phage prohead protease [unclassified Rhizobium]|uniref:HK97 family phage prohead protease n=1 Tax=unclassified Rhizobium TaxID=2613769 RepID=UPI0006F82E99|nr:MULTISPECIES: HK97 family phage prohead protease [unclassified Rhizobium]KQV33136.1 hypothetical protein ASC86_18420 [Rhizobium sp. Root1212]KRD21596.1 hypothetical protein ASE37_18920 [Rhizobium sp. Root268]